MDIVQHLTAGVSEDTGGKFLEHLAIGINKKQTTRDVVRAAAEAEGARFVWRRRVKALTQHAGAERATGFAYLQGREDGAIELLLASEARTHRPEPEVAR